MNFVIKNLPEDRDDMIYGTSFFGVTVGTTVNKLKDALSHYGISPVYEKCNAYEVSIEWQILINDLDSNREFVVTLYDYDHYNMASHPNCYYKFHIGANTQEEAEYFRTVMLQLFRMHGLDTECM